MLVHVLNLLFLDPHIIVILIIGIQYILIDVTDQPDVKINLDVAL